MTNKKNFAQKGQIYSLDYAISLILIFLAIGLAINFYELQIINAKETQLRQELQNTLDSSAILFSTSKDIVCEVVNFEAQRIDYINNCISETPGRLTKANLGLSDDYECSIVIQSIPAFDDMAISGCITTQPSVSGEKQIFTEKKRIVVKHGDHRIYKSKLESCIRGQNCELTDSNAIISVWRAD